MPCVDEDDYDSDSDGETITGVTRHIPGGSTLIYTRSTNSSLLHQADGNYKQSLDQFVWGETDIAFNSVGEAVRLYRQALKEHEDVASRLTEAEDFMKEIQKKMYLAAWVAKIGDQIKGIKDRVWDFAGF